MSPVWLLNASLALAFFPVLDAAAVLASVWSRPRLIRWGERMVCAPRCSGFLQTHPLHPLQWVEPTRETGRQPCLSPALPLDSWRRRQVNDWRRAVASDGGSAAPGSDQRPRISIATKMQGPGVDSVWPEDPKRPRDTRHAIGCFPARQPGSSAQCFVPSARVCQVGGGPPVHDSLAGPAQQATEACSS